MTAAAVAGPLGDVDRRVRYVTSTPAQRAELETAVPADWAPTVAQVRAVLARARRLQGECPTSTRSLAETVRLLRDVAGTEIAVTLVEHGIAPSPSEADWFRSVHWVLGAQLDRAARISRRYGARLAAAS